MIDRTVASVADAVAGVHDGATVMMVMMEHRTRAGDNTLVEHCSDPLTGIGCVSRVYTDVAMIDATPDGPVAREWIDGQSFDELARLTAAPTFFTPERERERS